MLVGTILLVCRNWAWSHQNLSWSVFQPQPHLLSDLAAYSEKRALHSLKRIIGESVCRLS